MPKLHELLAVESSLKDQAKKTLEDLKHTFTKKEHHFEEKKVVYIPITGDPSVEEQLDLQTTVKKELKWIKGMLAPAIDVGLQIDRANTIGKADIIVDGTTLAKDLPATALLRLKHHLDNVFELVSRIPTLDPAGGFRPDDQRGAGIYVARARKAPKTQKKHEVITLAPATEHHPAQAQLVTVDVKIGETETTHWSGKLTVAEKGEMLERIEKLRRAVDAAKTRANSIDADSTYEAASELLGYVFQQ